MKFKGETVWRFQTKKIQKFHSSHGEQNKRTTRPWRHKQNMNHVARKKLTEANLKKAFRIKLFELCTTRTKKSSPGLFNFYVISAGHDMGNDAGTATSCRRNFEAPWLQTERTKDEGPFEQMSFNGKTVWRIQKKKSKIPLLPWRSNQRNHKTPGAKIEHEPMQAGGNKLKQNWTNHSD